MKTNAQTETDYTDVDKDKHRDTTDREMQKTGRYKETTKQTNRDTEVQDSQTGVIQCIPDIGLDPKSTWHS